jgi:DNA-binding transcriptional MocR family regulator
MLLTLDRTHGRPLAAQIRAQILGLLERGALRVGEILPSTRQMAEQLGVHRTTVAEAYQELWSLGWIDLRPGSRARVRARVGLATARTTPAPPGGFPWEDHLSPAARDLAARALRRAAAGPGVISFRPLTMDPRLIPAESFRGCLNQAMRRRGTALLGYGAREGYRPLREYLARRLAACGIRADPGEILLTRGSQQALDLVFRMIGPGRRVALENPSYEQVFPLLKLAGQEPVPVPMGREGLDLDALEACFDREPPALLYTMPNFQNPTGISTSQTHRERLLALCARHGVPVLEDGFEEEMKYFGKVTLPLKSMDRLGGVLYCGTFSKVLLPGTRVGWIVAPEACIQALAAIRHASELCPDQVLPAALHLFCEHGH